jgi:hypothetical protein
MNMFVTWIDNRFNLTDMKRLRYLLCVFVLAGLFSCDNGSEKEPEPEKEPEEIFTPDEPIDWILDFGDEAVNKLSYSPNSCDGFSGDYKSKVLIKRYCMLMECPEDVYNYPIYPGMKEWAEFKTGLEMLDACQVPLDTVKRMSTQALIQALLEHPLQTEMLDLGHRYQSTFNFYYLQNNAYNELCTRPDAAASLVERLKTVNPLLSLFIYGYGLDLIEMILAQEVFILQLSTEERITAIRYALKKDQLRRLEEYFNYYSHWPFMCLMLGRILVNADYRPFVEEVNSNEELKAYLTLPSYLYTGMQGNIPRTIAKHAMAYTQIYNI